MINRLVHSMKLSVMLPLIIVVWATACCLAHGSAIISYVGLQVSITGIFAWQMYRVEKAATTRPQTAKAFVPQAAASFATHEAIAYQDTDVDVTEHDEVLVGA